MSVGPLRRLTAATGLVAIAPIAWLLSVGALSPEAAALRTVIVAVVVVVVGNMARMVLMSLLRRVETRGELPDDAPAPSPSAWDGVERRTVERNGVETG